jgi:DNA (cytosine-5)-methyltransferase 1
MAGQLFREVVRLLAACRPRAFLLENVPGLVSAGGGCRPSGTGPDRHERGAACAAGSALSAIVRALEDAGYEVGWRLIDARHWVAQARERLFLWGHRSDLGLARGALDGRIERCVAAQVARAAAPRLREALEPPGGEAVARAALSAEQWARINSEAFRRKSNRHTVEARLIPPDGVAPTLTAGYHTSSSFSSKYVGEEADGTRRETPRFLTPREVARLMGFPDSFRLPAEPEATVVGTATASGSGLANGAYRQLGNAIVPPVVRALAEQILLAIDSI